MQCNKENIQDLLNKSDIELNALVVDYLPEHKNEMFSPETKATLGKRWFDTNLAKIKKVVCIEWNGVEKLDDPALSDRITLIAAMSDVIAEAMAGLPVPSVILAVLVFRVGIRHLCQSDD